MHVFLTPSACAALFQTLSNANNCMNIISLNNGFKMQRLLYDLGTKKRPTKRKNTGSMGQKRVVLRGAWVQWAA